METPPARRPSRTNAAVACAVLLAAAALLVPANVILDSLRGAGPHDDLLVDGVLWLRAALLALAAWLAWEVRRTPQNARTKHVEPAQHRTWPLVAILAVGLLARLIALDTSLWGDEVETLVRYVRLSPGEIVSTYHTQNQQFLYSLLAKASTAVFGESAWALRLPAALLGVGSLYALVSLARAVGVVTEGLWAAALLAVSYHHVWFSQNARGYTGLLLAALVSTELLVRASRASRPALWRAYGLSCALGAWIHMNMIFVVAGQLAAWLALHGRRRGAPLSDALSGFVLAGLSALALVAIALPQILGPALADRSEVSEWKNPLWTLSEMAPGEAAWGMAAAGVAVAWMAWGAWDWLRSAPLPPTAFAAAIAAGLGVNMLLGHPIWPRFFFFAIGFAALAFVRGMRLLTSGSPRLFAPAMVVVLAASVATLPAAYRPKQDYTGARDFVLASLGAGERAAAAGVAGFVYSRHYAPQWELVQTGADLAALEAGSAGVWLLYSLPLHMQAYHGDVYRRVRSSYELVRVFPGTLGDGDVYVYRLRRTEAAP